MLLFKEVETLRAEGHLAKIELRYDHQGACGQHVNWLVMLQGDCAIGT